MNNIRVPSRLELNPYGDLDGDCAAKNWLGKSIEEGRDMIARNPILYQEDFLHMGIRAFEYYIESVEMFMCSELSINEEDFVHGILQAIRTRLPDCGQLKGSTKAVSIIASIASRVLNNSRKFYCDDSFLKIDDLEMAYEIFSEANRMIAQNDIGTNGGRGIKRDRRGTRGDRQP
jgi:hypothetical protein